MKNLLIIFALVSFSSLAKAQEMPTGEAEFRAVITQQLQAMAQDDASTAYAEISPNVQRIFPSADIFMNMVRGGYPAVYRHKLFGFGEAGVDETGRPYQTVEILGADGARYTALYFMERQDDDSWKISGVVMSKAPETDA